ncbi:MAG: Cobalt-zinc-cadmium resistance protein CzcD [uncultured Lysobacter sp.]|uniref:Cobalt-zinc-cadmium resistance protein CzcD n=1 Tax=uncultured Lysobacter sp. TaxID=271060 RepID=A0A6J4MDZ3_9GAMM|nr:MAG: Cobalt-zinc-cadmium resistance protein CzcD [uncultured Lysobacter sp.]
MLVSVFAVQDLSKALDRLWGPMHTHASTPAVASPHHRHEVDALRAADMGDATRHGHGHGHGHDHGVQGHDALARSSTRAATKPPKPRAAGMHAAPAHADHAHGHDGHRAMQPHAHATPARHWHDRHEMQNLVGAGVARLWSASPPLPPDFDVYWQLVPEHRAADVQRRRAPAVATAAALTVRASFDPLERPPRA